MADEGGLKTEKVFLASWLYPDAVAVAKLAAEFGYPVWLRVHGSDRYHLRNYHRRRMIIRSAGEAQGVICNSNAVASDLKKWGLPSNKIHVVLNGVDTSLFRVRNVEETPDQGGGGETIDHRPQTLDMEEGGTIDHGPQTPESFRSKVHGLRSKVYGLGSTVHGLMSNIPSSSPLILFVANLVPVKGPDIMLKAFAGVVKGYSLPVISEKTNNQSPITDNQSPITNNHPLLVIIGSGPLRKQLERLAGRLGIADRVHFLGNRPHKEVAQWMKVADVFCLTSRSEGMPNVVLEARASGLPVVVTPAGAIPELPLEKLFVAKSCSENDVAEALSLALASDLSDKTPSAVIPSWAQQAGEILELVGKKCPAFITVTNLFPWPEAPTRGLYNYYLFGEMHRLLCGQGSGGIRQNRVAVQSFRNICLVPEWRFWRWTEIRNWSTPDIIQHVASDVHSPASTFQSMYLPVFYLPLLGRSLSPFFYRRSLRQWAITVSPGDVLYVPWLYPDGVAVSRAVLGKRIRLWLMTLGSDTFHLQSPSRGKKILKTCVDAQGVVCVASILCNRLAAAGLPREKLHVVPNGVDTSLFRMRDKAELPIRPLGKRNPSSRTVLFVGNLVPVKGPDLLLRAFAALCEAIESREGIQNPESRIQNGKLGRAECSPDVALVIIGMGGMRRKLEQMARDLGIAEKVEFLGAQMPCDVATWMNRADLLCLPSRSEGMPNVVLEARASGLPVVATDVGACRELLENEPAARVCRSEDVAGLAKAMEEVLSMTPDRKAMAEKYAASYSWQRQAETILKLAGMVE